MVNESSYLSKTKVIFLLIVTSLGYFVDAADLAMASLVRADSLRSLGLAMNEIEIKEIGIHLDSWQSFGILLGGISWGILGDKIGRLKVLYLSILFYSIANLLNGFLTASWGNTLFYYTLFRFVSGFGLAGELGISITLISEVMKKEQRGIGTMIIAGFGILGCVAAACLSQYAKVSWDILLKIGGYSGLVLLFLRLGTHESTVYLAQKQSKIKKGAFKNIFTSADRLKRFLVCIAIGLPSYYVVGLVVRFSSSLGSALHITGVSLGITSIVFYITYSIADVFCNLISQWVKNRKHVLLYYNILSFIVIFYFWFNPPSSAWQYQYIYCPILGLTTGYWALLITTTAESFGTNIRATATTSVPNFIRSSFIPIAFMFTSLEPMLGTLSASSLVGLSCCSIAIIACLFLKESFGRDLNFEEN